MSRGFTLIELMVTLAIAAILASWAAPSFTRLIEDNRVTTQANDLLSSISLARSEAIKRTALVTITPEVGGYGNGWCIHTGAACNGTDIIRQHEAISQVAVGGSSNTVAITFDTYGTNTSNAVRTITLQPSSCTPGDTRQRTLTVNSIGHPRIEVTACS